MNVPDPFQRLIPGHATVTLSVSLFIYLCSFSQNRETSMIPRRSMLSAVQALQYVIIVRYSLAYSVSLHGRYCTLFIFWCKTIFIYTSTFIHVLQNIHTFLPILSGPHFWVQHVACVTCPNYCYMQPRKHLVGCLFSDSFLMFPIHSLSYYYSRSFYFISPILLFYTNLPCRYPSPHTFPVT